jgi:hypothetical protein
MDRGSFAKGVLASAALSATPAFAAEKVFRVAMTAADIPLTTGQASQGSEGVRFMGVTAYDALINWDLSRADRTPGGAAPGARHRLGRGPRTDHALGVSLARRCDVS